MAIVTLSINSLIAIPLVNAQEGEIVNTNLKPLIPLQAATIELRHKLNKYQHFSANFHQIVIDNKGREIQQATGLMKMRQPNKFHWVTNEPDESVVVSDGSSVWIYNPFVEQVTAVDLNSTMAQSPLWLIANQSDNAWSAFLVEKVSDKNDGQRYIVMPKDSKDITRKITMTFDNNAIDNLVIEDIQGQISTFVFSDFDGVSPIDSTSFVFELPSDVDFDDQREAK